MREKIRQSTKPPSRTDVLRQLPFVSFAVFAVLLVLAFGDDLQNLLQSSSWWSGVFAGAVMTLSAVVALQSVLRVLSRWNLLPSQPKRPPLQIPGWARCLLAGADSIATVAYASAFAAFVIDFGEIGSLGLIAITIAIAAVLLGAGLRWLADRLGWQWRLTASALRGAKPAS
jgi:hypothetical protein